jgi:hypothetical protein
MRVFLSHQQADSAKALEISARLKAVHGIDSYLDVIDPYLGRSGDDLAAHIRDQMARCTQLLAIVSYATRLSQWVSWEIGVATEKEFPLATFAVQLADIPEFLRAWPYLRSMNDVDDYAHASKAAIRAYTAKRAGAMNENLARRTSTKEFFTNLRTRLRQ